MKKGYKKGCPNCGYNEFCTEPNQYDIYEMIDGKLHWLDRENVDDKIKIFCRECGEELTIKVEYA